MATTQSAMKRWRQSLKRRTRHRATRSESRTAVRAAREAAAAGDGEAFNEALSEAYSVLDRAARKGAIPTGRADRTKRRLAALRPE
ncbi:MAG: 30S ribosomal protein S20 [Dehalococcoidia bacterium]|nr:30S ribosomal protein S20 [Chloroflexota bacterium]MXW27107.1 30S ribosomal protein S20 [Dehalococcoidia bacterium]MXY88733.1 30S ribosomal protein S20 [Dehalococcoidia bacterium]MXZ88680.1 30S ribosomal protein S20 [Dehalococcoidia bacterium]MYA53762.1 30S ribosomal protein S20 [Dehalococcoidia bacterium]